MPRIEKEKIIRLIAASVVLIVFLANRKLFFTLLLTGLGLFFIYTFGRNVHAKHPKVVAFGIALGVMLLVAALLCWFM